MTYNANELNQRVTVLMQARFQDPGTGIITEDFIELTKIWAKVEPMVGQTKLAAAAVQIERPTRITTRFNQLIQTAFDNPDDLPAPPSPYTDWSGPLRFVWRDQELDVESVDDIKGKRREMLIFAKG